MKTISVLLVAVGVAMLAQPSAAVFMAGAARVNCTRNIFLSPPNSPLYALVIVPVGAFHRTSCVFPVKVCVSTRFRLVL